MLSTPLSPLWSERPEQGRKSHVVDNWRNSGASVAVRFHEYAVRLNGGYITGCVGPLTDEDFRSRYVVEYSFDAAEADAEWAAAERARFTRLDIGAEEGWV